MHPNETKIYIAILIVAVALAIIIVFFTLTIIRHQRRSLRLYKEKIVAEINTLENERKRVASDLHDDLGPLVSAIKLQVSNIEVSAEEDKQAITKVMRHLDDLVQKIRRTSNDLVPITLERKGFNAAVDQFVATLNDTRKINVNINRTTDEYPDAKKSIHIFRMIQEMINNSLKHGQAKNCLIDISKENNHLIIMVSDDGIGFDFNEHSNISQGFGLRNIQSRAEMVKARLYINARQGNGVKYTIELPTLSV